MHRNVPPAQYKPDIKPVGELSVTVKADTDDVVNKCRIIAKHLSALANELDKSKGNNDEKACMVIDLLNELDDKGLKEMADYADALLSYRKG